jgi:glycine hydroxymethyltransferase
MAARILDLAGIVVNRNTIPGDRSARHPSGIRMGTPWVTQRGFRVEEMNQLADIIADLLWETKPYRQGRALRAKVDFSALEQARLRTRDLATAAGIDFEPPEHGYPHFFYFDPNRKASEGGYRVLELGGERVRAFLNFVCSSDVEALQPGDRQSTRLHTPQGTVEGVLACESPYAFRLTVPASQVDLAAAWLRDLSDGYIVFDDRELLPKVPGPVWVQEASQDPAPLEPGDPVCKVKPYYIGMTTEEHPPLPSFQWKEPTEEAGVLKRTPLGDLQGAKMVPFAGWDMPVWYTSVLEEHLAVRQAAGLFDVAHMGVYQVEGPDAVVFLDSVCGNDIGSLAVGQSLYTHILDPDANVIDDLLVYRRAAEVYLVVVNAANDDKDWAWLNAVKEGQVKVDNERPWSRAFGRNVRLRNLRDEAEGADRRVDLALQGPRARDVLLALGVDAEPRKRILRLRRTELCEARVGGFDLIISRTGYTGERMAFELFVHPDQSAALFKALLEVGEPFGLRPCGLGARDSLRTEAGLPLYGHEMGGDPSTGSGLGLGVGEAGFGSYVKTYKPWFIGRSAFLQREANRKGEVVRFRFEEKGVRMAHLGDPVVDKRGRVIGTVTSCAVDSEGFLTGQAFVEQKYTEVGTPIYIFQSAPKKAGKAPAELIPGDRVPIPTPARVVTRFR